MAGRAVRRPPFDAAGHLTIWAAANYHWVKGRALATGRRNLEQLPADEALAFVYVELIESVRTPFAQLHKVLAAVELQLTTPWLVTDETWGTGRAAEEASQAWEAQFPMASAAAPRRAPARAREAG